MLHGLRSLPIAPGRKIDMGKPFPSVSQANRLLLSVELLEERCLLSQASSLALPDTAALSSKDPVSSTTTVQELSIPAARYDSLPQAAAPANWTVNHSPLHQNWNVLEENGRWWTGELAWTSPQPVTQRESFLSVVRTWNDSHLSVKSTSFSDLLSRENDSEGARDHKILGLVLRSWIRGLAEEEAQSRDFSVLSFLLPILRASFESISHHSGGATVKLTRAAQVVSSTGELVSFTEEFISTEVIFPVAPDVPLESTAVESPEASSSDAPVPVMSEVTGTPLKPPEFKAHEGVSSPPVNPVEVAHVLPAGEEHSPAEAPVPIHLSQHLRRTEEARTPVPPDATDAATVNRIPPVQVGPAGKERGVLEAAAPVYSGLPQRTTKETSSGGPSTRAEVQGNTPPSASELFLRGDVLDLSPTGAFFFDGQQLSSLTEEWANDLVNSLESVDLSSWLMATAAAVTVYELLYWLKPSKQREWSRTMRRGNFPA
jgi:hypothetical protein